MGVGVESKSALREGGGRHGYFLELNNLGKVRRTQAPKFVGKLVQKLLIYLKVQTLTTKDCKGPQTKYAGKRRIYKDLISKNEK